MGIYEQTASEITELLKENQLVIFCGAGISYHSGIPLATHLKNSILNLISDGCGRADPADIEILRKSEFPFEALIEVLSSNGDITPIFDIYANAHAAACNSHRFIAQAMKSGLLRSVYTMNIDVLIEGALYDAKYHITPLYKDEDFLSVADDIDKDLKSEENRSRLIKFHGSVADRHSLGMTLSRVANRESIESKRRLAEQLWCDGMHSTVLILGYSCSDKFDMVPLAQQIGMEVKNGTRNGKKIIFIEHKIDDGVAAEDARRRFDEMFGFFEVKYICCDTDILIKIIQKIMGWDVQIERKPVDISDRLIRDYLKKNKLTKFSVMSELLLKNGYPKRAINYACKKLKIAKVVGDRRGESGGYSSIGACYFRLGKFKEAMDNYNKALLISDSINNYSDRRRDLSGLAGIFYRKNDHEKAIEYYIHALSLSSRVDDDAGKGVVYGNLGLCYAGLKKYHIAVDCHLTALHINRNIGNPEGALRDLGNLGISYKYLKKYQDALDFHMQALLISRQIGDVRGEGYQYCGLGSCYYEIDNVDLAEFNYRQALKISDKTKDDLFRGESLWGLALCAKKSKNEILMKDFILQARNIFLEIGVPGLIEKMMEDFGTI